jgi:hypothetical protein
MSRISISHCPPLSEACVNNRQSSANNKWDIHGQCTPTRIPLASIGVQMAHGPAARPTARRFGTAHGRHDTTGSVLVPARHEGPCGSWAAGLAHDTALARYGQHGAGTATPRLLSSHPHRQTASPSPPPASSPPHLLSSPSTAGALPLLPRPRTELARVHRGPWAAQHG